MLPKNLNHPKKLINLPHIASTAAIAKGGNIAEARCLWLHSKKRLSTSADEALMSDSNKVSNTNVNGFVKEKM